MSNCKYYMDINTWGQYDVKNVSRKWPLAKQIGEKKIGSQKSYLKNNFGWKQILVEKWEMLNILVNYVIFIYL